MTALALALVLAATPAVPVSDPVTRRDVLVQQLLTEERDTRIWYATWGLFWTASTVAQVASLGFGAPQDRASTSVWAFSSGLGALITLLLPPAALDVHRKLTPGADIEKEWVKVYEDEVFNQSLWVHAAVVALNLAPFLVLGLGYRRWDPGFLVLGLALSEAQIFSFPQLLRRFGVR